MNKKYLNHFLLGMAIWFFIISCKKDEDPGPSECEMKFIASWKVNEHYQYFEDDSLISEYTADYSLQFIPDGSGIISHPFVESESFSWECLGDTLSITNGMNGPLFVENGKYALLNETDSTLTLEKHQFFIAISKTIETWRTWNLSRK